jgi:hypothetical protein
MDLKGISFIISTNNVDEAYTRRVIRNERKSTYIPFGHDKIFRSEPSNMKMKISEFFKEEPEKEEESEGDFKMDAVK